MKPAHGCIEHAGEGAMVETPPSGRSVPPPHGPARFLSPSVSVRTCQHGSFGLWRSASPLGDLARRAASPRSFWRDSQLSLLLAQRFVPGVETAC